VVDGRIRGGSPRFPRASVFCSFYKKQFFLPIAFGEVSDRFNLRFCTRMPLSSFSLGPMFGGTHYWTERSAVVAMVTPICGRRVSRFRMTAKVWIIAPRGTSPTQGRLRLRGPRSPEPYFDWIETRPAADPRDTDSPFDSQTIGGQRLEFPRETR
jgi:hypothetical protein